MWKQRWGVGLGETRGLVLAGDKAGASYLVKRRKSLWWREGAAIFLSEISSHTRAFCFEIYPPFDWKQMSFALLMEAVSSSLPLARFRCFRPAQEFCRIVGIGWVGVGVVSVRSSLLQPVLFHRTGNESTSLHNNSTFVQPCCLCLHPRALKKKMKECLVNSRTSD